MYALIENNILDLVDGYTYDAEPYSTSSLDASVSKAGYRGIIALIVFLWCAWIASIAGLILSFVKLRFHQIWKHIASSRDSPVEMVDNIQ